MTRRVVFSPEAEADIDEMLAYISVQSDADRALGYVTRIVDHCEKPCAISRARIAPR